MEFAKPLLSLTQLKLKIFQVCAAANLPNLPNLPYLYPAQEANPDTPPLAFQSPAAGSSVHPFRYPNVFTMRKSRTRSSSRQQPAHKAAVDEAQLCLPLTQEADKEEQVVRTLKIVQREPRKQPECLLISGRMADVCAALERMARNERALQA